MLRNDDRIRELFDEVEGLLTAGKWNRAAFDRAVEQFKAAGADGEDLAVLAIEAEDAWLPAGEREGDLLAAVGLAPKAS